MPRADTLESVRQRGHVVCGVFGSDAGFARHDASGQWFGIEIDACRALAVAALGRKDAVSYRVLLAADRYKALKSGDIDVLAAHTSLTMTRDSALGLRYAATLLHDGTAMMVRRRQAVGSTLELSGASVCALDTMDGAQVVRDYFSGRRMRIRALTTSETWEALVKSYLSGQCTALAGDATMLARTRAAQKAADDHIILPERLSVEPIGLFVREGSERWFSVVRWTVYALVAAEEAGVTSANVEALGNATVTALAARRLLGMESHLGRELGLPRNWTREVVRNVGNYGELYERNFGARSPLKLDRGLNNLWSKGGLMLAPPFR